MKEKTKRFVSSLLAVMMIIALLPATAMTAKAEGKVSEIFEDVKEDGWYVEAVQYVYDNGIMVGTGSTFGVNNPLKREQFAATLYSMAGKPAIASDVANPFSDVSNTPGYPRDGILWAVQTGVAKGNADGTFGVGKKIQRQAVASMLYKYAELFHFDLQINDDAIAGFSDVSNVQNWAETAMKWAVTQGIISGKGGNRLDPTGTATRAECAMMIMKLMLKNPPEKYKVGDYIKFGKYEQNNNTLEKEDIEWQILEVSEDRILVVSRYALDCKKYHEVDEYITWEGCTLRSWLNNEFLNEAFTDEEKARIPLVTNINENNTIQNADGGNATEDYVFCLSVGQTEKLFGPCGSYSEKYHNGYYQGLICVPTEYAIAKGINVQTISQADYNNTLSNFGYSSDVIGMKSCNWWLRTSSWKNKNVCIVTNFGNTGYGNSNFQTSWLVAVRPAMYILRDDIEE